MKVRNYEEKEYEIDIVRQPGIKDPNRKNPPKDWRHSHTLKDRHKRLKKKLDEIPDAPDSAVIISGDHNDPPEMMQWTNKTEHQKAIENFKQTVIIRPSVVCGPEDNFTNLFSKLSILPIIPVVGKNYKFQPILVSDVVSSILKAIEIKNNESKIYEIGGPKIISFGDMVKSILSTINKKRFVVEIGSSIKCTKYSEGTQSAD